MTARHQRFPKLCGADLELANFISGLTAQNGTGYEASRRLLCEIDGWAGRPLTASTGYGNVSILSRQDDPADNSESQDWGRKYLRNGGCGYIDLNHLEVCIPETLDATDHVASTFAMYRLANLARESANRHLPEGQQIHLLANNSDGQGHSFGSHLNVLIARQAWESIFRRIQVLGFLASFHASSVVVCGLGKVSSENGAPPVDYQCSQRADFMEKIQSLATTFARGILNTRHEPLCGPVWRASPPESEMSRFHIICCDHNLCHGASLVKIGGIQIVLAMVEAGVIDSSLILDDPVQAMKDWSHDPSLQAAQTLISGAEITAVDWQCRFLDAARRFAGQGGLDGIVPNADAILDLWADTVEKLAQRRFEQLTGRLDWVLKRAILEQAAAAHHLEWSSPALKRLDHLYSDLDPATGLYWAFERAGVVERRIPETHITRREFEPPENTRAWTRGALLSLARPDQIDSVDWDRIRFRFSQRWDRPLTVSVQLNNPLRFTKTETEQVFRPDGTLEEALTRLDASGIVTVETPPRWLGTESTTLAITTAPNPENTHGPKPEDTDPNK